MLPMFLVSTAGKYFDIVMITMLLQWKSNYTQLYAIYFFNNTFYKYMLKRDIQANWLPLF